MDSEPKFNVETSHQGAVSTMTIKEETAAIDYSKWICIGCRKSGKHPNYHFICYCKDQQLVCDDCYKAYPKLEWINYFGTNHAVVEKGHEKKYVQAGQMISTLIEQKVPLDVVRAFAIKHGMALRELPDNVLTITPQHEGKTIPMDVRQKLCSAYQSVVLYEIDLWDATTCHPMTVAMACHYTIPESTSTGYTANLGRIIIDKAIAKNKRHVRCGACQKQYPNARCEYAALFSLLELKEAQLHAAWPSALKQLGEQKLDDIRILKLKLVGRCSEDSCRKETDKQFGKSQGIFCSTCHRPFDKITLCPHCKLSGFCSKECLQPHAMKCMK